MEEYVERLLTVKQVAELLSVKTSWVYLAADRGELPCVRVGRYLRFSLPRIESWIAVRSRSGGTDVLPPSS